MMRREEEFKEHRFLGKLIKAINAGYSPIFFNGDGVNDYYLYDEYIGIRNLKNTLFLYTMNRTQYEAFVYINQNKTIKLYNRDGIRIESSILFGEPESTGFGSDLASEELPETNQKIDLGSVPNEEEQEKMTFVNDIHQIEKAVLDKNRNFFVYMENFEWLAGLYSSEPDLEMISFINKLSQAKEARLVISIKDTELLKEYGIDIEEDMPNNILLSNPSDREINNSFRRYILKKSDSIIDEVSLKSISKSIQSSKKTLRESIRVLKDVLYEKPKEIKEELFEMAIHKPIEEKIMLSDVILPQEIKKDILSRVDTFYKNDKDKSKGLILHGPPGTGKTLIAKAIASEYHMNFMAPTLAELKGEYIGQTSAKVQRIFEEARNNAPTILFLDEIDTILTSRNLERDGDSFTKDMVNQFLVEIDGAKTGKQDVFVIGATNRLEAVDSAIQSRLNPTILINLPNKEEREQILNSKFKKFTLKNKPWKEEVLNRTEGMSGRDLDNFVKAIKYFESNEENLDLEIFNRAFRRIEYEFIKKIGADINGAIEVIDNPKKNYNSIIGYEYVKERFDDECGFIKADEIIKEEMMRLEVFPDRGTIMFGPPGNGKTTIVEAVAGEHNFYLIKILSKDFSSYSPEITIRNIESIFYNAIKLSNMTVEKQGVILFFDEIETLLGINNLNSIVRGTLLNHLENNETGIRKVDSKILLVGATNYIEYLDSASIRAGRIDKHIIIDNPSRKDSEEILRNFFEKDKKILLEIKGSNFYREIYERLKSEKISKLTDEEKDKHSKKEIPIISIADLNSAYKKIRRNSYLKNRTDNTGRIRVSEVLL